MEIRDILSPDRISIGLVASSKKKLLEIVSQLLARDGAGTDPQAVFQCLIERERLGSTGIGDGVALPHGRLKGLKQAIGAFAVLQADLDFDAIDRKPVRLVFALLVPESATTEHLQLLAKLAALFSHPPRREQLLGAKTPEELYTYLTYSHRA
jgi:PTS system nitrogen regulatory IIA component